MTHYVLGIKNSYHRKRILHNSSN